MAGMAIHKGSVLAAGAFVMPALGLLALRVLWLWKIRTVALGHFTGKVACARATVTAKFTAAPAPR